MPNDVLMGRAWCLQYEKEVTIMQQANAMTHINQQLIAEQRANSELKRMLYEKSDDGHQLLEKIEQLKRQLQCKVCGSDHTSRL